MEADVTGTVVSGAGNTLLQFWDRLHTSKIQTLKERLDRLEEEKGRLQQESATHIAARDTDFKDLEQKWTELCKEHEMAQSKLRAMELENAERLEECMRSNSELSRQVEEQSRQLEAAEQRGRDQELCNATLLKQLEEKETRAQEIVRRAEECSQDSATQIAQRDTEIRDLELKWTEICKEHEMTESKLRAMELENAERLEELSRQVEERSRQLESPDRLAESDGELAAAEQRGRVQELRITALLKQLEEKETRILAMEAYRVEESKQETSRLTQLEEQRAELARQLSTQRAELQVMQLRAQQHECQCAELTKKLDERNARLTMCETELEEKHTQLTLAAAQQHETERKLQEAAAQYSVQEELQRDSVRILTEKVERLEGQVQEQAVERAGLISEVARLQAQAQEHAQRTAEQSALLGETCEKLRVSDAANAELRGELTKLQRARSELDAARVAEAERCTDLARQVGTHRAELQVMQLRAQQHECQCAELTKQLDERNARLAMCETAVRETSPEHGADVTNAELRAELTKLQHAHSELEATRFALAREVGTNRAQLQVMQLRAQQHECQCAELTKQLDERNAMLRETGTRLQASVSRLQTTEEACKDQCAELTAQLEGSRAAQRALQDRLSEMEHKHHCGTSPRRGPSPRAPKLHSPLSATLNASAGLLLSPPALNHAAPPPALHLTSPRHPLAELRHHLTAAKRELLKHDPHATEDAHPESLLGVTRSSRTGRLEVVSPVLLRFLNNGLQLVQQGLDRSMKAHETL